MAKSVSHSIGSFLWGTTNPLMRMLGKASQFKFQAPTLFPRSSVRKFEWPPRDPIINMLIQNKNNFIWNRKSPQDYSIYVKLPVTLRLRIDYKFLKQINLKYSFKPECMIDISGTYPFRKRVICCFVTSYTFCYRVSDRSLMSRPIIHYQFLAVVVLVVR